MSGQPSEDCYVLDTSALVAYLAGEEGSQVVADLLCQSSPEEPILFLSFVSLMEIAYQGIRKGSKALGREVVLKVQTLPLTISFENDLSFIQQAAEIKAYHPLSLADAWIAALVLKRSAILVHKDPEFEALSGLIRLLPLPYKKRGVDLPFGH